MASRFVEDAERQWLGRRPRRRSPRTAPRARPSRRRGRASGRPGRWRAARARRSPQPRCALGADGVDAGLTCVRGRPSRRRRSITTRSRRWSGWLATQAEDGREPREIGLEELTLTWVGAARIRPRPAVPRAHRRRCARGHAVLQRARRGAAREPTWQPMNLTPTARRRRGRSWRRLLEPIAAAPQSLGGAAALDPPSTGRGWLDDADLLSIDRQTGAPR